MSWVSACDQMTSHGPSASQLIYFNRKLFGELRYFFILGWNSRQEKTRLQPTPTGPGICPVITSSQHTQYFLLHFAFAGIASHRISGIWVQSTAMNVPGV